MLANSCATVAVLSCPLFAAMCGGSCCVLFLLLPLPSSAISWDRKPEASAISWERKAEACWHLQRELRCTSQRPGRNRRDIRVLRMAGVLFHLGSVLVPDFGNAAARIQSLATPRWPSTQQPTSNRRDLPSLSRTPRGACALTGPSRASAERGECERRKQCTCFHSACRSRSSNLPFLLPRTQSDLWCVWLLCSKALCA